MDPSPSFCLIYDTLNSNVLPSILTESFWFSSKEKTNLTLKIETLETNFSPEIIYCDNNLYKELQNLKDLFDDKKFQKARDETNPFENIGRSIFMNRAAIKLSNIDSVHKVTNHDWLYDKKQSEDKFTFCDIASGPGGFTQYLQYRFPRSQGYGMTLKHPTLDFNTSLLDLSRFTIYYGSDNTGNLYTNWSDFITKVKEKENEGVDLVTADGGFDLESEDKSILRKQEFLSSRLLLTQSLIGLRCTKIGGNFVMKCFDTVTNFSAQVIFLLARSFEKILIFKPISSRPANSERYILCFSRKYDIDQPFNLLSNANYFYTDTLYITSIFPEPLPIDFRTWLISLNNLHIKSQLQACNDIITYLNGSFPSIPLYDLSKFLLIWNLPETPQTSKKQKTVSKKISHIDNKINVDSYVKNLINNIKKSYIVNNNNNNEYSYLTQQLTKLFNENVTYKNLISEITNILKSLESNFGINTSRNNERINIITEMYNGKPRKILDIGAGNGDIILSLKNFYNLSPKDVLAIDSKLPNIPDITVLTYQNGRIPLRENSIDLIVLFAVLHHIEPLQRDNLMKEISRILSKNGSVIIREHDDNKDPNFYKFLEILHIIWYLTKKETEDPLYLMSRSETQELFQKYKLLSKKYQKYEDPNPQRLYHELYSKY